MPVIDWSGAHGGWRKPGDARPGRPRRAGQRTRDERSGSGDESTTGRTRRATPRSAEPRGAGCRALCVTSRRGDRAPRTKSSPWEVGADVAGAGAVVTSRGTPSGRGHRGEDPMSRHVLTVAPGRPECHRTITAALTVARSGSIINVASGRYDENLHITVPVTIVADEGRGSVVVEPRSGSAVVLAAEAATLCRIVLRSHHEDKATVEVRAGRLTMEDCDVQARSLAGAAAGNGASLVMRGCHVANPAGAGVVVVDDAD